MYAWMSYGYRTDIRISYGYRSLLDAGDGGDLPECMCGVARATWSIPDSPFLDGHIPALHRPSLKPATRSQQVPAVKDRRVRIELPWGCRADVLGINYGCTADDRTDDVRRGIVGAS